MKRLTRFVTVFLVTLTLGFYSVPFANAETVKADDDIITIVHTNDMHGRLAVFDDKDQKSGSRLVKLKAYVDQVKPDLLVDGGDAIQGLPISNLNKGEMMLKAMIDIGYDAMAVGNHEFDFGLDNILELKATYGNEISILSTNTLKDGKKIFDRSIIKEVKGKKIAIIGVTTPESEYKTHPNNIKGVTFTNPLESVKKEIDNLDGDFDLIVVVGHLGDDSETKEIERGTYLAEQLGKAYPEKNFVVIDGHSHQAFPEGEKFGDNVIYAQTGEYINNIGHVYVNLNDFSKSSAKLIDIKSVNGTAAGEMLDAEKEAQAKFKEIGSVEVIDNFPFKLEGNGALVRTREMALGNMVTDAMMAYGKGLSQKPDLAVVNGGGLRTDLPQGKVTVGDIIAIMPFGNLYTSAEVKGSDIITMFEHSYRSEVASYNDDGHPILDRNGGFLQVSGAKIVFNALADEYDRVLKVYLDTEDGWKLIDENKTYVLATNDFLLAGGDGYESLKNHQNRIEGEALDEVLIKYFKEKFDHVDWDAYKEQEPRSRIFPVAVELETVEALNSILETAKDKFEKDYTEATFKVLVDEIEKVESYLELAENYSQTKHEALIKSLEKALGQLEKVAEQPKPVKPKPEEPKPVETKPVVPEVEKPSVDGTLPATGYSSFRLPLLSLGIVIRAIAKRKEY